MEQSSGQRHEKVAQSTAASHDHINERLTFTQLFSGSLRELQRPPKGQIPFLDGLRAVAILLVVTGHLSTAFAERYGNNRFSQLPFVQNGWIGVDLFFVLSGFLIGGQLWKALRQQGAIHVGDFMLRRTLRIWPLYLFVFLCVLGYSVTLGAGAAAKQYGWSDLLFITNYHNRGLVMGSWSLCTEEQFYLITPLALWLCARHLRAIERCRPWLWSLLVLVALLRAALWVHATGHFRAQDPTLFATLYYMSVTHCDGLIMGLILANLWETRTVPARTLAQPTSLIVAAVAALVLLHVIQKEIFDFTALALVFGSLVWFGVQQNTRIFNPRLFYWLSRLSFGMYLNHEYFAPWVVSRVPQHFAMKWGFVANLLAVGVLIFLSAGVALGTFCLVEHPFLRLRKRLLSHTSQPVVGTRDLAAVTR